VMDTIDVAIVGMGSGSDIPQIRFDETTGNIPISAAGCTLENIQLTVTGTKDVVAAITVTAANVTLKDLLVINPAVDDEMTQIVLADTGADGLTIDGMIVRGNIGSVMTQAIDLSTVDNAIIKNCVFYGLPDNWIEFAATCTNVLIDNCVFDGAVTPAFGFTHNVLDTAGDSVFTVRNCYDRTIGAAFDGSGDTGIGLTNQLQTVTADRIADDAAASLKLFTVCGSVDVHKFFAVITGVMNANASTQKPQYNPDAAGATDISAEATVTSNAAGTHFHFLLIAANSAVTETAAGTVLFSTDTEAVTGGLRLDSRVSGVVTKTAGHTDQTGTMRWSMAYTPSDRGSFMYVTP